MQGIAVSETEKEVNAFPATPVTVLINIGACSIDCSASRKALGESPVSLLKYLPKNEQYRTAIGWSYFNNYQGQ